VLVHFRAGLQAVQQLATLIYLTIFTQSFL